MASGSIPASSEDAKGANGSTAVSAEASLQQRYIELLELRIAQLEAVVKPAASQINPQIGPALGSGLPIPESTALQGVVPAPANEDSAAAAEASAPIANAPTEGKAAQATESNTTAPTSSETVTNPSETTLTSRYRKVKREWNRNTATSIDTDWPDAENDKKKDTDAGKAGDVAFTLRRVYPEGSGGTEESRAYTEVDIEAAGLKDLLRAHIGKEYPGQTLDGDKINIVAPFRVLIHSWDELLSVSQEKKEDEKDQLAREDLAKLLEMIQAKTPELASYFKTRETHRTAAITTFDTLWTLFPPKELVYAKPHMKQDQVFEMVNIEYPDKIPGAESPSKLWISAWSWEHDGDKSIKVFYWHGIKRFTGTKDIKDLECYPLKYHAGGSEEAINSLKASLVERGKRYEQISQSKTGAAQMWLYDGSVIIDADTASNALYDNKNNHDEESTTFQPKMNIIRQIKTRGNIIVDHYAHFLYANDVFPMGSSFPITWEEEEPVKELTAQTDKERNLQLMLRPPRVLGYFMKEKRWAQFTVDSVQKASGKKPEVFKDKLELDPKYKDMIRALVEEHQGHSEEDTDAERQENVQVRDLVTDKGRGLVLLLHGPPGVGKTLTAETIAEATGKPLFVVSVAEIGLDASKAERNLEQLFYLAGRWESVLLVDEADVFLESRTQVSDPNRNALVSVLLRVLEYYNGIMILTTNRINSLDIAVQSRIHLAIRYDDLSVEQKKKIFRVFLDCLEPDNLKDKDDILDYVDEYGSNEKLNGREIRNIVSSALGLSRSQANRGEGDGRMTKKHLRHVLGMTKDFQEQLEAITRDRRTENEANRPRR